MPRIAVISGYYNRAPFVRSTVESIITQTCRDLTLHLFDDASTDDTQSVIAAEAERLKDDRFQPIFNSVNTGFTTSLIQVIDSTDSEFIAIQGSGDYSSPNRLERQVCVMDSDKSIGLLGTSYTNIHQNGHRFVSAPPSGVLEYMSNDRVINKTAGYTHGTWMIRRRDYEKAGGYRAGFVFQQDHDLELRMLRISRLAKIDELLYDRYVRSDGVTYSPYKLIKQTKYEVMARMMFETSDLDAAQLYSTMVSNGVNSIVPDSHPNIQRRIIQASIRSILNDGGNEFREIYQEMIRDDKRRMALGVMGTISRMSLIRPLSQSIYSSRMLRKTAKYLGAIFR